MEQNLQLIIPFGWAGLYGGDNLSKARPEHVVIARNVSFFGGVITREGGSTKYNTTPLSGKIIGGKDWYTGSTHRQIAYIDDDVTGKILKDLGDTAFSVVLKDSLNAGGKPVFVEGGQEALNRAKKLFIFDGKNIPQVLSGDEASTTDIGYGQTTKPVALAVALRPSIQRPDQCGASLAGVGAGNVNVGKHSYKVTFVNSVGETEPSVPSLIINATAGDGIVNLTNIPVSPDSSVIARKIYRTVAGDTGAYKLLTTLADNVTTSFVDNIADASLGADAPSNNTTSTKPLDWTGSDFPLFGCIHEGRLFAGGNPNAPHTLYYSTQENHEDFESVGSGIISVFSGEGERIVGVMSFKGLLIIWKYPKGIYAIDTTQGGITSGFIYRITGQVGGQAQGGILQIDDDVIFLDASANFQALSTIQEFGDVASRNISGIADIGNWFRRNVNLNKLDWTQSIWYPKKREAIFALTSGGSQTNDMAIVLDFNDPELVRFRESNKDAPVSIWLVESAAKVLTPFCGDSLGYVWKLDQDTKNKDNGGYDTRIKTAPLDFGYAGQELASKFKTGMFLEIIYDSVGYYTFSIDVFWDDVYKYTIPVSTGALGAVLGAFVLDTDALAATSLKTIKKRLYGSGKRLALELTVNGANQDFSISQIIVHCKIGEFRA